MSDLERDIDEDGTGKEVATRPSRIDIEMRELAMAPPVISEPRCKVCQSEWRVFIERQLVKGMSYKAIAESTPPDAEGNQIDRRSISSHYKKHMAINDSVVRAVLEQEADLLKQNVEEGVEGAITNRGILKVGIRKIFEDMLNGTIEGEVRDLVQMMKLLNEMEVDSSTAKNEESEYAVRIFMRAIQNVCDDEMRVQIGEEVKRLRQLDKVDFAMEEHLTLPRRVGLAVSEAEVIDDPALSAS